MTASIGILNVGVGDTKLTFDKSNPAECIRAARIVTDMLRRGYALLVEVDREGVKAFQRVLEFREDTCEYIIADYDPLQSKKIEEEGAADEPSGEAASAEGLPTVNEGPKRGRPKLIKRAIPASGARGVAVARSAGG